MLTSFHAPATALHPLVKHNPTATAAQTSEAPTTKSQPVLAIKKKETINARIPITAQTESIFWSSGSRFALTPTWSRSHESYN